MVATHRLIPKATHMTKSELQDVVDLGAASVETKGMNTQFEADELAQHKPNPGLSND